MRGKSFYKLNSILYSFPVLTEQRQNVSGQTTSF